MALLPDQPKVPRQEPGPLMLDTYRFGPHECYSHGGFWGTIAMYCPDIDVAVVDSALRAGRE